MDDDHGQAKNPRPLSPGFLMEEGGGRRVPRHLAAGPGQIVGSDHTPPDGSEASSHTHQAQRQEADNSPEDHIELTITVHDTTSRRVQAAPQHGESQSGSTGSTAGSQVTGPRLDPSQFGGRFCERLRRVGGTSGEVLQVELAGLVRPDDLHGGWAEGAGDRCQAGGPDELNGQLSVALICQWDSGVTSWFMGFPLLFSGDLKARLGVRPPVGPQLVSGLG
jgi:hypothetical protein